MGYKRLGISLLANIISMIVSLGISFLLTPFLISSIGKEAYSFFPLANNFASYMTIITMALNSMASRFITISLACGEEKKAHTYFSTVFFSNVILSIILMVPMTIIIILLEQFLHVPKGMINEVRALFFLIFVSFIINLLFSVFGVATFAKERMDLYAIQSIAQNVLRALLFIVLFLVFRPSIILIGIVIFVLAIFNGVIQYIFSKKLMPDYHIRFKEFEKTAVFELISSGIWNSVNNIGTSLLQSVALIMANVLIGVSAAGDLSIVQTLPNLMTTVICAVYGVLLPRIANVYALGDKEKTAETVIFTQKILGITSTIPVVLIILFGKHFFLLWVPGEDAIYYHHLSIISILPLLIHSSMWTVYGLNVMNNKLKKPAILFVITGMMNIVLTILVTKFTNLGIYAIPLVSGSLSILYYFIFVPSYTAKEMDFPKSIFYPHIIKTICYTYIVVILGMPLVSSIQIRSWIGFFVYMVIAMIITLLIYIILVFSREDRKKMTLVVTLGIKKFKRGF